MDLGTKPIDDLVDEFRSNIVSPPPPLDKDLCCFQQWGRVEWKGMGLSMGR
jgi:hypothetical protein